MITYHARPRTSKTFLQLERLMVAQPCWSSGSYTHSRHTQSTHIARRGLLRCWQIKCIAPINAIAIYGPSWTLSWRAEPAMVSCQVWCVMCHVMSCHVMCHVSCVMSVMCHVSCVMCHVSCVMCHVMVCVWWCGMMIIIIIIIIIIIVVITIGSSSGS